MITLQNRKSNKRFRKTRSKRQRGGNQKEKDKYIFDAIGIYDYDKVEYALNTNCIKKIIILFFLISSSLSFLGFSKLIGFSMIFSCSHYYIIILKNDIVIYFLRVFLVFLLDFLVFLLDFLDFLFPPI